MWAERWLPGASWRPAGPAGSEARSSAACPGTGWPPRPRDSSLALDETEEGEEEGDDEAPLIRKGLNLKWQSEAVTHLPYVCSLWTREKSVSECVCEICFTLWGAARRVRPVREVSHPLQGQNSLACFLQVYFFHRGQKSSRMIIMMDCTCRWASRL